MLPTYQMPNHQKCIKHETSVCFINHCAHCRSNRTGAWTIYLEQLYDNHSLHNYNSKLTITRNFVHANQLRTIFFGMEQTAFYSNQFIINFDDLYRELYKINPSVSIFIYPYVLYSHSQLKYEILIFGITQHKLDEYIDHIQPHSEPLIFKTEQLKMSQISILINKLYSRKPPINYLIHNHKMLTCLFQNHKLLDSLYKDLSLLDSTDSRSKKLLLNNLFDSPFLVNSNSRFIITDKELSQALLL